MGSAPKSTEAKAFLVIAAEEWNPACLGTHGEPAGIVNGCLENASRAIVNRVADKFDPSIMQTKGPVQ